MAEAATEPGCLKPQDTKATLAEARNLPQSLLGEHGPAHSMILDFQPPEP